MAKLAKDMAMLCPSLLSEFLSCVKNSCDTISVDQVEILSLFKTNILAIKSEVDTCLNKLIGREIELKFLKNSQKVEKHVKKENPSSCLEQPPYKNRIVIHGLSSLKNARKDEAVKIVNTFFSSTLKVSVNVENVDVLKPKNQHHTVAIISLSSIDDRRKIFGNCHRLKYFHERVSVTDNVPPKTRNNRKHLLKTVIVGTDVKYDSEPDTQSDHERKPEGDELKISNVKSQSFNENKVALKNVGGNRQQKKNSRRNTRNMEEKGGFGEEIMEGNLGGIGKMEGNLGGIGKMEGNLGGIGKMEGNLGGIGKMEGNLGGIGKMEGNLGGIGKMEGNLGGIGKMEGNLGGIAKTEGNLIGNGRVQGVNRKPEEKFGGNHGGEESSEIVEALEKCLSEAFAKFNL